jgi:alpha-galactosidase
MIPETKEILMNEELIAIDQDPMGKQGFCYRDNGDYEIWVKPLENREKAVCLLNRGDEIKKVQVDYNVLLAASQNYWNNDPYKLEDYTVRDLWEHKDIKITDQVVYIELPPHSVKAFRFSRK